MRVVRRQKVKIKLVKVKVTLEQVTKAQRGSRVIIIIITIIIIIIYCNWVITRWQWLFYMYTKHEIS